MPTAAATNAAGPHAIKLPTLHATASRRSGRHGAARLGDNASRSPAVPQQARRGALVIINKMGSEDPTHNEGHLAPNEAPLSVRVRLAALLMRQVSGILSHRDLITSEARGIVSPKRVYRQQTQLRR